MKTSFKKISLFTLFILLFTLVGCAGTQQSESTGQYLDSSSITTKVKTELAKELGVRTLASIQVTTYKGIVQLSGFVEKQSEINKAVKAAKSISGVKSVENSLLVKTNVS